jgi:hypothetical protein
MLATGTSTRARSATVVELSLDSWTAEECPLCRRGVPIDTSVGKGREFLAAKSR